MYDKKKCEKCQYHAKMSGLLRFGYSAVCCDYLLKTRESCLKRNGEDIRGDNPKNCKLFVENKPFWFDEK